MIKIGDSLPDIELTEANPLTRTSLLEVCRGKKAIIFATVGAFTPGCTTTHLPGYVSRINELRRKGFAEVICVTVNDIFVVEAWAKLENTAGKVRMLADPDAEFTKALGMDINIPTLGGIRSKRYSMVVTNNVVKQLFVEPDGVGLTCSLADRFFV